MHDVFRRDWRDPLFAVAGVMESGDAHVFGDVVFRSEPVATAPSIIKGNGSLKRRMQSRDRTQGGLKCNF
jgi:hypothetical protein